MLIAACSCSLIKYSLSSANRNELVTNPMHFNDLACSLVQIKNTKGENIKGLVN